MDITITRTFSDEQASAVQSATDALNNRDGLTLTAQDYLGRGVDDNVNALTAAAYSQTVVELGAAAAKLSFAQRQVLIAQVQAAVGG